MLVASVEHEPSEPRLTSTPASSSSRTGATPEPSIRLLHGLCCVVAPLSASSAISRGVSHTAWIRLVAGLRKPMRCRCSTIVKPWKTWPVTTCSRVSCTWLMTGSASSSASARMATRKPSLQRCGADTDTSTPTRLDLGCRVRTSSRISASNSAALVRLALRSSAASAAGTSSSTKGRLSTIGRSIIPKPTSARRPASS